VVEAECLLSASNQLADESKVDVGCRVGVPLGKVGPITFGATPPDLYGYRETRLAAPHSGRRS
jgi:hypothetical protein